MDVLHRLRSDGAWSLFRGPGDRDVGAGGVDTSRARSYGLQGVVVRACGDSELLEKARAHGYDFEVLLKPVELVRRC